MRRFTTGVALLAALALVAAGCSDSADTGLPDTSSPLPTEQPGGGGDIEVVDNAFEPRDFTVAVGKTVVWSQTGVAPHTVTASDDSFDSHADCPADTNACMKEGDTFPFTFDEPGEIVYYCKLHGTKDGSGMAGTITVEA